MSGGEIIPSVRDLSMYHRKREGIGSGKREVLGAQYQILVHKKWYW